MNNIFFDLDGTLLDSKQRLYHLFVDLTNEFITIETYWDLKRKMYSNQWILSNLFSWNNFQISEFSENWMKLIEADQYLNYDNVFPFTNKVIENLYEKYNLFVVTNRQNEIKAKEQLVQYQIFHFFNNVLVSQHEKEKTDLINSLKIKVTNNDFIVGDTGIDIQTGKKLGVKTIAVLTGFRNRAILETYKPDFIWSSIEEFYLNLKD